SAPFTRRTRSGNSMFSPTVMCRNRAYDWKTNLTPRACGGSPVTSRPCRRTRPASASVSPAMIRSTVLLPLPLGPRRTKNSPSATSSDTSFTTGWPPYRLLNCSSRIDMMAVGEPPCGGASPKRRYAPGVSRAVQRRSQSGYNPRPVSEPADSGSGPTVPAAGVPRDRPSILRMSAPIVVSFWMRAAFTFVDTAYAATLGDAAVAAVGLTIPFEFLMIACWVGVSTGLTSHLSQAMGARQGARIEQLLKAARTVVWILVPIFAAIGVGSWFWAPYMGLPPDVARMFGLYCLVLIGGSAFTSFWSIIPDSIVKAHHDTRATMWAGIWSNLINVALNTLFTFVFHW